MSVLSQGRMGAAMLVVVAAAALSACASDDTAATAGDQLPDLTEYGLTEFTCGEGDAIGGSFQPPSEPYVAQCWVGTPDETFLDIANHAQDAAIASTGGKDVTAQACPEDALGVGGGIACRAVLVGEGDSAVLMRSVTILAKPTEVLDQLPESPTQEQIEDILVGAQVEVLVGTEPIGTAGSPSPSATS